MSTSRSSSNGLDDADNNNYGKDNDADGSIVRDSVPGSNPLLGISWERHVLHDSVSTPFASVKEVNSDTSSALFMYALQAQVLLIFIFIFLMWRSQNRHVYATETGGVFIRLNDSSYPYMVPAETKKKLLAFLGTDGIDAERSPTHSADAGSV